MTLVVVFVSASKVLVTVVEDFLREDSGMADFLLEDSGVDFFLEVSGVDFLLEDSGVSLGEGPEDLLAGLGGGVGGVLPSAEV